MAGAKRNARIEITSSAAGVAPGLADARRQLRNFSREQQREAKQRERDEKRRNKELRKSGGALGTGIAAGAGAVAGMAAFGSIGDAVSDVFDVEKEMTRFQIDAQLGADKLAEFRAQIMKVSEATGVSRNAIVHAAHAYQILTGDAQGAIASSELFAKVANASGASMDEIAAAAAAMRQSIKLDPADFQKGFDIFLKLGHEGSIELRDVAAEMSGLMPQFKDFGNKSQIDKLAEMAATMEVVKFNFANAAETATGFRSAMTAVSKSKVADNLAKHGVKVWEIDPATGNHEKRDFIDIVKDIHDKIKDKKVLADVLGGRQESYRAILALVDNFDKLNELKAMALNSDQVAKDNATFMESSAGRMAKAWEHIKNAIAEAFTPERIEKFAAALGKVADFAANAVGAVDRLINGPGKEEGTGAAANDLIDLTYDNSVENGRQKAIEMAQSILRNSDFAEIVGAQRYGSADAARSGAYKFLQSEGMTPDAIADALVRAMRRVGVTIGPQQTTVKVGSEPIVKATGNSPMQRTRPGGRS